MVRKLKNVLLMAMFLMFAFVFTVFAGDDAEAKTHTVKYGTVKGTAFVNTYPDWNVTVTEGKTVRTPKIADKSGKRCYWKIRGNGGATGEVINGGTFTVKGNTEAVVEWKPIYTIRFFKYNGAVEQKDKQITLAKGEKFYLPNIIPHESKLFLGWSKIKNATTAMYNCTKEYTMVGNIDLYEVVVPRPKGTVELKTW